MKAQTIRLLDVWFIRPVMVLGGARLSKQGSPDLGGTLAVLGILTVVYNGVNYVKRAGGRT